MAIILHSPREAVGLTQKLYHSLSVIELDRIVIVNFLHYNDSYWEKHVKKYPAPAL